MSYTHITQLDDPEKPWKRVWLCEATGVYVKTHANRRDVGFGRIKWDMTGSLCDANGKALTDAQGAALVHVEGHGLSVQTDQAIRMIDARALLNDLLNAETSEAMAAVKERARALRQKPLAAAELEAIIAEDFERELRFVVARVERAALLERGAARHGGCKPKEAQAA